MNLIFDFDGTLVDSFSTAIKVFNLLAGEFGFRKANDHEIADLRHLTAHELIKYFKIPMFKVPRVLLRARSLMRSEMDLLTTHADMKNELEKISKLKIKMGIVTSNSSENVIKWLKRNNLHQYFSFIHDAPSFFGKHRTLMKVIKSCLMDKHETFYVGDETRDIEAAKKCGISSIAVAWGFNSEKILSSHAPDYLVKSPGEIVDILKSAVKAA